MRLLLVTRTAKPDYREAMLAGVSERMMGMDSARGAALLTEIGLGQDASAESTVDGVIGTLTIGVRLSHLGPVAMRYSTSLLRRAVLGLRRLITVCQSVGGHLRDVMLSEFLIGVELRSSHSRQYTAWSLS
jgi:hypothetical protein